MRHLSGLTTLLPALVLTALAIWAAQQYAQKWQIARFQSRELPQSVRTVLDRAPGPIELEYFVPRGSNYQAVAQLVERFQDYKSDIAFTVTAPEAEPDRVRELGIQNAGELMLSYGERRERLSSLSVSNLANTINRLRREHPIRLVFIAGHDERMPDDAAPFGLAALARQLTSIGVAIETANLVTEPFLETANTVAVIADPVHPYLPGEVAALLDYIGRGGHMLMLLEPGTGHGLTPLLIETGVELLPGVVIDINAQQLGLERPDFAVISEYPFAHPVINGFAQPVLLPEAVALNWRPDNEWDVAPILRTQADAWTEQGQLAGRVAFDADQGELAGPLTLGFALQRQREQGVQRIVVIGDADFAANAWAGNGGNLAFAQRIVSWLGADDSAIDIEPVQTPDAKLGLSRQQIGLIVLIFGLLVPLLLVVGAAFAWRITRR